jgi:PKD repeat protein
MFSKFKNFVWLVSLVVVAMIGFCTLSFADNQMDVPLYGQRWASWSGDQLGTCSPETIGTDGCAISSLAMVFSYYGSDVEPPDMNEWLKQNNGYSGSCLVKWDTAANYTENTQWIGSYDYSSVAADLDKIKSELDSGYPVIAEVRLSGYKHFLVITGYSGGTFYINDPWYGDSSTINERYHSDPARAIYGIRLYHGEPDEPEPVACTDGDPTVEMEYLQSKGVIENIYKPGAECPDDRAVFVYMAVKAIESVFGTLPVSSSLPFTDVSSDAWYYDSLRKAYRAGLITDQEDHKFKPADTMPRKHAILVVQRAMANANFWNLPEPPPEYSGTFADIGSLYPAEKAAIKMAKYYDVARGRQVDNFEPNEDIIRQESAWFVFRMMTIPRDLGVDSAEVKENESFTISHNAESQVDIMVESPDNLFESNTRVYAFTIFKSSAGCYYYRTRMKYGEAEGGWSDYVKVEVIEDTSGGDDPVEPENKAPLKPTINGPDNGYTDVKYTFTATSSDPDGDEIEYRFKFLNEIGEWQSSNKASFTWTTTAPHAVYAQARDSKGAESNWSSYYTINITRPNGAPPKPQIAGNRSVEVGKSLSLRAWSLDPDGDAVSYIYDWGDGNTTSVAASENQVSASHTWDEAKIYIVRVKAEDTDGNESEWSETEINVYEPNLNLPTKPTVSGPRAGLINQSYTFKAEGSTDADGDSLEYSFVIFEPSGTWDGVESEWSVLDAYTYRWTRPGTYCVKAAVRDRSNEPVYSGCHTITIYAELPECKISITRPTSDAPIGPCGYMSGHETKIIWQDDDGDTDADIISSDVYYSLDGGATWKSVATGVKGYSVDWLKPDDLIRNDVIVKVESAYNTGCVAEAISDPFDVIDGRAPFVTVSQPASGEVYEVGQPVEIQWEASCAPGYEVERVDLKFLPDGDVIARLYGDQAKSGVFTWYPDAGSLIDRGRISARVSCTNCTETIAESNGSFKIENPVDPESECKEITPFEKELRSIPHPDWKFSSDWVQRIQYPDVFVDENGDVHVIAVFEDSVDERGAAYYDQIHHEFESGIYYRRQVNGEWQEQETATNHPHMTDSTHDQLDHYWLEWSELAVDSSGTPHIAYEFIPTGGDWEKHVYYVHKTPTGWSVPKQLSSTPSYSLDGGPKIVVDQNDDVYVFWYNEDENKLYYRVKSNGSWSGRKTIEENLRSSFDVSVDDRNILHLVARYRGGGRYHIQLENGEWSEKELFSDTGDFLRVFSTDSGTYITSAYIRDLSLFENTSGTWALKEVLPWEEASITEDISFWTDDGGSLNAIYYSSSAGKNILKRTYDGSSWSDYETVSQSSIYDNASVHGNGNKMAGIWDGAGRNVYLAYCEIVSEQGPKVISFDAKSSEDDPLTVDFTVEAREGSSPIVSYQYSFGDGNNESAGDQTTISHTYTEAGTYPVSVMVTDESGVTGVKAISVTVTAPEEKPVLSAPPSLELPAESGETALTVTKEGTGSINWTAEADVTWLTLNPDFGTDNGTITVAYETNTGAEQTGKITIRPKDETIAPVTVTVTQKAGNVCVPPNTDEGKIILKGTNVVPEIACSETGPYVYTVSGITGAETYKWTVSNAEIVGDDDNDQVTLNFGADTEATITVIPSHTTPSGESCAGEPLSLKVALDSEGVWPGDIDYDGIVKLDDINRFVAFTTDKDCTKNKENQPDGFEREEKEGVSFYDWTCHPASDFTDDFLNTAPPFPSVCENFQNNIFQGNLKHLDCNGDGKIDPNKNLDYDPAESLPESDLDVIIYNIAYADPPEHSRSRRKRDNDDPVVHLLPVSDKITADGREIEFKIVVGGDNPQTDGTGAAIENVEISATGINFEIRLNQGNWEYAGVDYSSPETYSAYYLGINGYDLLGINFVHPAAQNIIMLAMQRTVSGEKTFVGKTLCSFSGKILLSNKSAKQSSRKDEPLQISLENVHVFDDQGNMRVVQGGTYVFDDADRDGIPDDSDIFPDNPDEWSDNDQDGIGDNTDPDDDNDTIPDDWETENDLDPLADDTQDDPDGDGCSNLQEYKGGTDPNDSESHACSEMITGVFNVGEIGFITIDWLYDGGAYKGELGLFSLEGMDLTVPDLQAFITEAVSRVLSNEKGCIVLSDPADRAQFSGVLGGESKDWNEGIYRGAKSFDKLERGEKFALILVPNSTFTALAADPGTMNTNRRPLFSFTSPNADYGMHVGQVADINGYGLGFVFEDMEFSRSDMDYNDLIIQISGAVSEVPTIDEMLERFEPISRKRDGGRNSAWYDWRTSDELGRKIIAHLEAMPLEDDQWFSVSIDSETGLAVYDTEERTTDRNGSGIPGTLIEFLESGGYRISLPAMDAVSDYEYRIMLRPADYASGSLTVNGYEGYAELSADTKSVDTEPHLPLRAELSASQGMPPYLGEFGIPAAPDGTPLIYDGDGDGDIDDDDIERVYSLWNVCDDDPEYDAFFDLDDDGCITILDIMPLVNGKSVH